MLRLEDTRTTVVGLGKSGLAAIDLLVRKGARVRAVDERADAADSLREAGIPFRLQAEEKFEDCDLIVLSPGVPADLPEVDAARARGIQVIGEVELAWHFLQGRIAGVTGSNGKTTTTALLGHILSECGIPAQVGGNIGTPPTAMVQSSRKEQWNVLELSSYQLETVDAFQAQVGICMNVTPDHLDRHHTFENYARAKRRLFETLHRDGLAVLNADDATCVSYAEVTQAHIVWFSSSRTITPGLCVDGDFILMDGEKLMPISDVPLRGRHNLENAMAAAAAARFAGASQNSIAAAIRGFSGVEHRLAFVRRVGGVDYFNDSKATNVDATLKAVDAFEGGLWIILGGKDKGSSYAPLRQPLREKARAALLIGAAAEKIAAELGDAVERIQCGTLENAVAAARARAISGETVLLAPACASFDQFQSYEHRGKAFKTLVMSLEESKSHGTKS
jgi:UDP-N-acetylmuramoylalanine--D-glutamate ligase